MIIIFHFIYNQFNRKASNLKTTKKREGKYPGNELIERARNGVAVVAGGAVVESGGHEALMAKKGAYYQLVNSQVL